MIDWLRRADTALGVEIGGQTLPIDIRRNARARRLTLRLAPDGTAVRITLPRWCPERDAIAFVHARTGWLTEQLAKVALHRPPEPGHALLYRGRELAIDWREGARRTPMLEGSAIVLGGPRDRLVPRLQRWLEARAKYHLSADIAFFAARARIDTPELRLSRAQRRWGSCSTNGTVRINWRLVQAPDDVRRSVVAHEIAHCLHFDHSPAFHAALAQLFHGDLPAADRWLKVHGRTLYASFG
jgi:predicted metal-dependent hydrolase